MKTQSETLNGQALTVAHEAVPGRGEDTFFTDTGTEGGLLCVADGCGGSGARRYTGLDGATEAGCAARIAVECVREWHAEACGNSAPSSAAEARARAGILARALRARLIAFHREHREALADGKIIANRFLRTLPTTLCFAQVDAHEADHLSCVFGWAGDSRGYILRPDGLRQYTADHSAGQPDAMENLYRDARLSNVVNADGTFTLETFGLTVPKPCVVITATDGAYAYLPTPMEFELLLLKTLESSSTLHSWHTRLSRALAATAGDDSTLLLTCFGADDFTGFKACFTARRSAFQAEYVTPVRRRGQNPAFARSLWAHYRQRYEGFREDRDADWHI